MLSQLPGQLIEDDLQFALARPFQPVAEDLAERGAGDQHRLAVMRHADAVREVEMIDHRPGLPGGGIVDDETAVRPPFHDVERIGRHLVARGAIAEIDLAVGRDVEIVCHAQPAIVVQLVPGAVGLVGHLEERAVRLDAVDAHAGNRDDQVLVPVELHAERPSADMGEDIALLEVRAGETNDVAVAGAAVEPVVPIEDDVLGTLHLVEADGLGVDQAVVLGKRRVAAALQRRRVDERHSRRIDVNLLNCLAAVLGPFDVDADGRRAG